MQNLKPDTETAQASGLVMAVNTNRSVKTFVPLFFTSVVTTVAV